MKNATITALGLSTILIGLVPVAQAQETTQQVPKTADVTLSGDSLRTVESRTIDSDYTNLIAQPDGRLDLSDVRNADANGFRLKLNRELEVITTPSDAASQGNPLPPRRLDSGSEAGVQLQLTPTRSR
ncbi:MAG: hypothetical protein ACM37W_07515 [Actinomycetota bacterium]